MATKATASNRVDVVGLFDIIPFTPSQIWFTAICLMVMLLEGFDSQVIALAGPRIAQMLHLSPQSLGVVLSANSAGAIIGSMTLGTMADRLGRKRMLVFCTFAFGALSVATAWITTVEQLTIIRLVTGIFLGGSIPNALALGVEYAPRRIRASITTLLLIGIPGGGVLSGLLAAYILPRYNWQALFLVGGVLPLAVGIIAALFLPESLAFLANRGRDTAQIRRVVARISPSFLADKQDVEFYSAEKKRPGVPVKHLFSGGLALTTLLLWILFFMSLFLLVFMAMWIPSLLRQSGVSVHDASLAFSYFNIGSVLAGLITGRIMDRFNPYWMLAGIFVAAAIMAAAFGALAYAPFLILSTMSFLIGCIAFASAAGLFALATICYPATIRGTGVGWAYAIGKTGSVMGPVIGGILLTRHFTVAQTCLTIGLTGIVAAIGVIALKIHLARSNSSSAAGQTAAV